MPVPLLTATASDTSKLTSADAQARFLARDCVQALPDGGLTDRLRAGRPLRVKLGLDPTAPELHLGHSLVLSRLREFQDLGHTVVLIIGDMTAQVGDPSGRSKTRPALTVEQIETAAATYTDQAMKILDADRLEVRRNSEWLNMRMTELFALARTTTVGQLLERNDFADRMNASQPVSVLELLYPLIQGFDSVAVQADVELGGTDQLFNLMLARDIQRQYGVAEQVALTLPILTGTDGIQKMSKSLGNHVGIAEPAEEIFGKTMSIPDELIGEWARLLFDAPAGTLPDSPYTAKRLLAASLAERFAGPGEGVRAAEQFDAIFKRGENPDDMPTVQVPAGTVHLPALLEEAFNMSRRQARQALTDGAVKLDGERLPGVQLDMPSGQLIGRVLRFGKRKFVRLA
jgi:tyrosyl-tRNA synthetase